MKQLIETTFPCKTGNCIETRTETIFWVDEHSSNVFPKEIRGKSFTLIKTIDYRLFTINNPYQKEITFVAIDAGIFMDSSSKCDFALFDNERFCFVECKNSVAKQRSKERNGAFVQLKATILRFKENLDFGSYKIEAQVSMKARMVFPRRSCSREDMVKEFDDELAVALFENNDIEF